MKNFVQIKSGENILFSKIKKVENIYDRTIGLMFKKEMSEFEGLILEPCNSIHTHFMKFELDIVFIDKNDCVVKIIRKMKPWRMTRFYFKAVKVLEVYGGTLTEKLEEGDKLDLLCLN